MIISEILGGLGNQMFQYALGRALAIQCDDTLKMDISAFESYKVHGYDLNHFTIQAEIATTDEITPFLKNKKRLRGLKRLISHLVTDTTKRFVQEQSFPFDPTILQLRGDIYLSGYWQSQKYFLPIRGHLLKEFSLRGPASNGYQHFAQLIGSTQSVSLHIRRGDYISNENALKFHGICPLDYYRKAVDHLNSHVQNLTCFIFSDDIEWAKANLDFLPTKVFVSGEEGLTNHEEMLLMSLCQHNIIANSTFSWWGAWLNLHDDKMVIAPAQWFKTKDVDTRDLIPQDWLKL